ncbi:glycosyltransferase [Caballeronia novacaledonica]|uniref:Glycosyltransferase n=1 Tax=Caballeronia novacaledonica TaxID=1544861 RepID=A0AA37IIX9_9BURK|nr:glycosyltransferase [Caballeronia novacaledonica]GJH29538.1 glycosyltransferase [Caballeronia novacaledonica]
MKLLHVIVALNADGAERMLQRLIESHIEDPRFRHVVCSLTTTGKVGEELAARGIDVHSLGMRSPLGFPRALWHLVKLIRKVRPDIIQTWMYHADFLGGLAGRLAAHKRIVWGVRTTDVKSGGSRVTVLLRKICAWLSYSVPQAIVCAAEASRRAHVSVGYDASRMMVVPNGFDVARLSATPEQRAAIRQQCGFEDGTVVVGILGRFHPVKDHENFVRAAGMLAARHPDVRFMMVGRDLDASNRELADWIAKTGFASRFVLLGERRDVPACLSAMDVFCLSSRTEGFPNVVGEAMAMALPCVVTDVGDAAMLVANTGVVVAKENTDALAAGLSRVVDMTPDERIRLGQMAKARIHAEFTMMRARERFEDIYLRLVQEK